jgi:hypothetical protein
VTRQETLALAQRIKRRTRDAEVLALIDAVESELVTKAVTADVTKAVTANGRPPLGERAMSAAERQRRHRARHRARRQSEARA